MKLKALIIVGPTASGKSALAVELARTFGGEIISADSRQVYRGLDIGTGKITRREMHGVPHHLLDVAPPKRVFTAGEFVKKARRAVTIMIYHNARPIIVGGTGFYIDALLGRVALPNVPANPSLRARLEKKSATQLYEMLRRRDRKRARALSSPSERNNKRRLIRALEIAASKHSDAKNMGFVNPYMDLRNPYFDVLWIGVAPTLKELERKITKRLNTRMKQGMVAEAKRLHAGGLSYKRMEEFGLEYRSLARYLQKKITKQEMIEELSRDIRRYAKKQLAYWKRNPDIKWFKPSRTRKIAATVKRWLAT